MPHTLYRGLRTFWPDRIKEEGMRYYWQEPARAIDDIFIALKKNHMLNKLGDGGVWGDILRDEVISASHQGRIQQWATEVKENAESYARATPELIFLVLCHTKVPRDQVIKYLNRNYGKPHVVSFIDTEEKGSMNDINIPAGKLVEPNRIIDVYPVTNTDGPDPYMTKLLVSHKE